MINMHVQKLVQDQWIKTYSPKQIACIPSCSLSPCWQHTHTHTWYCKSAGRGRYRETESTLGISSREGLNTGNSLQMYREPRRIKESRSYCPERNTTSARAREQGRWCYREPRSLHSCWCCSHSRKRTLTFLPPANSLWLSPIGRH